MMHRRPRHLPDLIRRPRARRGENGLILERKNEDVMGKITRIAAVRKKERRKIKGPLVMVMAKSGVSEANDEEMIRRKGHVEDEVIAMIRRRLRLARTTDEGRHQRDGAKVTRKIAQRRNNLENTSGSGDSLLFRARYVGHVYQH